MPLAGFGELWYVHREKKPRPMAVLGFYWRLLA